MAMAEWMTDSTRGRDTTEPNLPTVPGQARLDASHRSRLIVGGSGRSDHAVIVRPYEGFAAGRRRGPRHNGEAPSHGPLVTSSRTRAPTTRRMRPAPSLEVTASLARRALPEPTR